MDFYFLINCSTSLYNRPINNGDVLISWSASLGVYIWKSGKAVLNQHIFKVIFDKAKIDKIFFVYQVKKILEESSNEVHGATMKHLTKPVFDALVFKLPTYKEQCEISNNLNKVSRLISLHKQQIKKLDLFVKSRFIEMFGDPLTNSKGWSTKSLTAFGRCKNGMNFSRNEEGTEINCLGVGDFKDLSIIEDTSLLPTVSLNDHPSKDYLLKDDDIVFVRSNGNKKLVGRCLAVYPGNVPTVFSGFCIRYRMYAKEKIETKYLLQILKSDGIRMKMVGRGANIQNLNQQILSQLQIPIAPIELQNKYSAFVKQVDKSKLAIQKSLDKLEILQKSLMQQYFG